MKLPVNYKSSLYARVAILNQRKAYTPEQYDNLLVRIERATSDKQMLAINKALCSKELKYAGKCFIRSAQSRANIQANMR